jgi:quercetin dioxygenase-like cupin family protein
MATEPTPFQDDERIRVIRWTFSEAGDSTGEHVHEYDYVVVPVTGGEFVVEHADGSSTRMTQLAGTPYSGVAGTRHTVSSDQDATVSFVEIELKVAATH